MQADLKLNRVCRVWICNRNGGTLKAIFLREHKQPDNLYTATGCYVSEPGYTLIKVSGNSIHHITLTFT